MGGNFFLFFTVETWKPIKHSNQNAWVMFSCAAAEEPGGLDYYDTGAPASQRIFQCPKFSPVNKEQLW
jgi:hypothetical protein